MQGLRGFRAFGSGEAVAALALCLALLAARLATPEHFQALENRLHDFSLADADRTGLRVPAAAWIEGAATLLVLAFLALGVPRLRAWPALAGLVLIGVGLLVGVRTGLPLTFPAALLALGLPLVLASRRWLRGGTADRPAPAPPPAHGGRDLDHEERRRTASSGPQLLDRLYQLARDFEREQQFDKAHEVYRYISGRDAGFRDVPRRMALARVRAEQEAGTLAAGGDALPDPPGADVERQRLGRYPIERELGRGAMGAVYLARDPKTGRRVALKTLALSPDFPSGDLAGIKARFFREAGAASHLAHPNIVQIFETGEDRGLAYIAMEFIKGHDLMAHTRPKTLLPVSEVLRYVADAAEALDYAHGRGIVHRDIKPANLMVATETRSLKVTDFGIARFTDAGSSGTGMVMGTPSYMSPEQVAGRRVDGRSDLYSLGVSAYQLLTGSLPFQAPSLGSLLFKISNETPARLSDLRAGLPAELDAVIGKAMEKDRDARYASGREFAQALRAAAA